MNGDLAKGRLLALFGRREDGGNTAEVSGCPLKCSVDKLLRPLARSGHLAKVEAAGCKLTGVLPDLRLLAVVESEDSVRLRQAAPLANAIQVLDLSKNALSGIDFLNAATLLSLMDNERPLAMRRGLLSHAVEQGIRLELMNTSITASGRLEAEELLRKGNLSRTLEMAQVNKAEGYFCYDLADGPLQVTPALVLPELCRCLPGWQGERTLGVPLKSVFNTFFGY